VPVEMELKMKQEILIPSPEAERAILENINLDGTPFGEGRVYFWPCACACECVCACPGACVSCNVCACACYCG